MSAVERMKQPRPLEARKRRKNVKVGNGEREFGKRQRAQEREWVLSVREEIERYLAGKSIPFSEAELFVLSPMQEGVKNLFLTLGNQYLLDAVPDESEQRLTHLVLESEARRGQRRVIVGELSQGDRLEEQGVRVISFRRQRE